MGILASALITFILRIHKMTINRDNHASTFLIAQLRNHESLPPSGHTVFNDQASRSREVGAGWVSTSTLSRVRPVNFEGRHVEVVCTAAHPVLATHASHVITIISECVVCLVVCGVCCGVWCVVVYCLCVGVWI